MEMPSIVLFAFCVAQIVFKLAICEDQPPIDEFLLITQAKKIGLMRLPMQKYEPIPMDNLKSVIATDFDMERKCLFYHDSSQRTIARTCEASHERDDEVLLMDIATVEGMSYDWASHLLYFTNPTAFRIEAIKVSAAGNGTNKEHYVVVEAGTRAHLRGIAVTPVHGYMFWSDWSTYSPSISRANLDGSNVKVLRGKPMVYWPNGLAIDNDAYRVYWVDADLDAISRCDFDGNHFEYVLRNHLWIRHPFAITVRGNEIYWNDWALNAIFYTDKGDLEQNIVCIYEYMLNLINLLQINRTTC